MSLACGVAFAYLMFTRHERALEDMTAIWLLPVVAAEVAGASGDAPAILTANGLAGIAVAAKVIGTVTGLLLWGFGFWWLALATLITIRYWRAGVPFNLGWWGYTFPLDVSTVVGTVRTVALAALWLPVGARTLDRASVRLALHRHAELPCQWRACGESETRSGGPGRQR